MKKNLKILCLMVFAHHFSMAQTNTFPTSGSVGVGTTNPLSVFHVNKGVSGATPHYFSGITLEDDEEAMVSILTPSNKSAYFGFADESDSYVGGMQYEHNNDRMIFRVNDHLSDMVINASGNVGVGTSNPNSRLQVKDGANMSISLGALNTSVNGTSSEEPVILLNRWTGNSNLYVSNGIETLRVDPSTSDYGLAFTRMPLHVENDYSNSYVSMYIENSNGHVGIGTTAPDEKLSVNGNIHTKEVRVDLDGWSDFVFKDDYKLPTLQEVENHIKDKGHLKDIPSAKEVAENGILLGEMDAKLLQKIEELMLYTIEQQKEINAQKEKIGKLEKENLMLQSVSKRIEQLERLIENLTK